MNYGQLEVPRALVSERESKNRTAKTLVMSELSSMVNNIGLSTLENCCAPLLAIIVQLGREQAGVEALSLKQGIIDEIVSFEILSHQAGIDEMNITAMRYVLCAVIDEFILNQQYRRTQNWNEKNDWSRQSLINTFYDDAWGGEKFYEITENLLLHPRENQDCLKLILFFLNLGYEGKYRLMENGVERLALLKEKLSHVTGGNDFSTAPDALSPRWTLLSEPHRNFWGKNMVWITGVVALTCLVGCFLYFNASLTTVANPLMTQLNDINKGL